jgi:hypothetical protein
MSQYSVLIGLPTEIKEIRLKTKKTQLYQEWVPNVQLLNHSIVNLKPEPSLPFPMRQNSKGVP